MYIPLWWSKSFHLLHNPQGWNIETHIGYLVIGNIRALPIENVWKFPKRFTI